VVGTLVLKAPHIAVGLGHPVIVGLDDVDHIGLNPVEIEVTGGSFLKISMGGSIELIEFFIREVGVTIILVVDDQVLELTDAFFAGIGR
jgi:hypothetical protein